MSTFGLAGATANTVVITNFNMVANVTVTAPNQNVFVDGSDFQGSASAFLPVTVASTAVFTNLVDTATGTLENGISMTGNFSNPENRGFSQSAVENANPLLQNYFFSATGFGVSEPPVTPGTITFSGLDTNPSTSYDFYFLAAGDIDQQGSRISLTGRPTQTTAVLNHSTSAAILGENLVAFEDVLAPSGSVTFGFDTNNLGGSDNFLFLSGGQIVATTVPEPSTGVLIFLSVSALAIGVRRRVAT